MTGTVTVTDTGGSGKIRKITVVCISNSSGNVASDAIGPLTGELQSAETIPDGTDVPTAYNVKVRRDSATAGFDLLNASGATRSTTARELCRPEDDNGNATLAGLRDDLLYVTADTVGNAKKFTIVLTIVQP